jgi:hypothetical protein
MTRFIGFIRFIIALDTVSFIAYSHSRGVSTVFHLLSHFHSSLLLSFLFLRPGGKDDGFKRQAVV